MTTLSEQEKAWQDFNSKNITPLSAWDRKLFRAGFEAGLAYNKTELLKQNARIEELEAALRKALETLEQSVKTIQAVVNDMQL